MHSLRDSSMLRTIPNFFFFLQDVKNETVEIEYDVSATPIKDKSLLSHHAQKLCENTDAYWMTPTCTAADSNERKFSQCLCVFGLFHFSFRLHF